MSLVDAAGMAMNEMTEDFVILDLPVTNKAEVRKMLETDSTKKKS